MKEIEKAIIDFLEKHYHLDNNVNAVHVHFYLEDGPLPNRLNIEVSLKK